MTSYSWNTSHNGLWTTSADWSPKGVPGLGDDVTISTAGSYQVSIYGVQAANSLTLDNPTATVLDGGAFTLGTTLALTAGTFTLATNGSIIGGTLLLGSGAGFVSAGGTLNGSTVQGTLALTPSEALQLKNNVSFAGIGGTGQGTLIITGAAQAAGIDVLDSSTLANVAILLNGKDGQIESAHIGTSTTDQGTLTLAADTVLDASNGIQFLKNTQYASSGGTAYFNTTVLDGQIAVQSGTLYLLGGTFSNGGSISVADHAKLYIDGTVTSFGNVTTAGTGVVVLDSAGVIEGTVNGANALFDFNHGLLDGVTWEGTLKVGKGQDVAVAASLTLLGAGGSGAGELLDAGGTVAFQSKGITLDNATVILAGNGSRLENLYVGSSAQDQGTLTLGPNLTLSQQSGNNHLVNGAYFGTLLNQITNDGTISGLNGTLAFDQGNFLDNGLIKAGLSSTIDLTNANLVNLAAGTLTGGLYAVSGSGVIDLPHDAPVTTLDASVSVAGAGPGLQSLNTSAGTETTLAASLAAIGAAGSLAIGLHTVFAPSQALTDAGQITLDRGTLAAASGLTIDATGTLSGVGGGTVSGTITDNGTISAASGTLTVAGPLSGTGTLLIGAGAALALPGADSTATIAFAGPSTLLLADPAAVTAPLAGLSAGDIIDLQKTIATAVTVNGSTLAVTLKDGSMLDFTLAAPPTGLSFSLAKDGRLGTDIVVSGAAPAHFGRI